MPLVRKGWQNTQTLRGSVLGWPLGAVPGDEDDASQHLFSVDADGRDAAVVSFTPHACPLRPGRQAVYLWAMAVRFDAQGVGHGTRLVNAVLEAAREAGATVVWADARLPAVPFYERLGFTSEGATYVDDVTGRQDQRVAVDLLVER
ncbi:MAG: GNAT family N-acetyltransferase [Mycobacteriales bacterium]